MTENEKIKQVLTSMVEQNRYVFWYDEGGQMKDIATSLDVPGISVLEMEDNAFSIKFQMQKGKLPETGFVIYSAKPMPKDEQNWLLDYQEEGALFSADMSSLYAAECGIAMELKEKVVDKHLAFFKKADNRNKLAAKLSPGMDAAEIEKQMTAVVCKSNATCEAFTYALITEANNEETTMQADLKAYNLEDFYWQQAEAYFGYHAGRNIKDLLIVLFKNDMQSHLTGKVPTHIGKEQALTNEALIFMRDWRDSRTNGDLYTEWANRLEEELGIKEEVCEYNIQQLLNVETFPCIDKIIASYLLTEVINDSITTEQMEAIIEERENKLFFDVARHTLHALLQARYLFADIEQKMSKFTFDTAKEGFSLYERSLYTIDLHYRHYIAETNLAESKQLLSQVTERVERTYTNHYLLKLAKKWQQLIDGRRFLSIRLLHHVCISLHHQQEEGLRHHQRCSSL